MKTYILTEENIEKLREEFCISKLQSDTFDEMLREFEQGYYKNLSKIAGNTSAQKTAKMNNEIFIENQQEYNQIKEYLKQEGYYLNRVEYKDEIYTFNDCYRATDNLIYKITARITIEGIDYLSEVVGWYVDDDWEI